MNQNTLTFQMMKPAERSRCAALAARAFEHYPYFTMYVPEKKHLPGLLRDMMASQLLTNEGRAVFLTAKQDEKFVAMAMLCPPSYTPPDPLAYIKAGFWKVLLRGGFQNMAAWYEMNTNAEAPCAQLTQSWFLSILAVDTDTEGRGIGSCMLRQCILPYIKEQGGGQLCLFTNSEINRRFYQKNGFQEFHAQKFTYKDGVVGSWSYQTDIQ